MKDLTRHPKLKQLARNLHIPDDGDCLRELRDHALESVQQMLKEWNVETIDDLRFLVADKLSVKIEHIGDSQDVEILAEKYGQVMGSFRLLLRAEFIKGDTEGLLIDNPKPGKGDATTSSSLTPEGRERRGHTSPRGTSWRTF